MLCTSVLYRRCCAVTYGLGCATAGSVPGQRASVWPRQKLLLPLLLLPLLKRAEPLSSTFNMKVGAVSQPIAVQLLAGQRRRRATISILTACPALAVP